MYSFETQIWQPFSTFPGDLGSRKPSLAVIRHENMIYAVFFQGGPGLTKLWANPGDEATDGWELKAVLKESHGSASLSVAMIPYRA